MDLAIANLQVWRAVAEYSSGLIDNCITAYDANWNTHSTLVRSLTKHVTRELLGSSRPPKPELFIGPMHALNPSRRLCP